MKLERNQSDLQLEKLTLAPAVERGCGRCSGLHGELGQVPLQLSDVTLEETGRGGRLGRYLGRTITRNLKWIKPGEEIEEEVISDL